MTGYLPLCHKGGQVYGYALVDAEDYERFAVYRWHVSRGYVRRILTEGPPKKYEYLHRAVLGLGAGREPLVDHRNRNPLDCRRANLRLATDALNAQNQGARARTLRASEHRGVVWDKTRGKWRAQAVVDGRCHNLGRFDDEGEAARVVAEFRAERMPYSEEAA